MPDLRPVVMKVCNILSLNISTGLPIPNGETIDMHTTVDFRALFNNPGGDVIGLEMDMKVGNAEGYYFTDVDVRARAIFDFSDEMEEAARIDYLNDEAPVHMIDAIRLQLRQITAGFEFGSLEIPPIPATVLIDTSNPTSPEGEMPDEK